MATDSYGTAYANIILEKINVPTSTYSKMIQEQLDEISDISIKNVSEEEVEFAGETYTKLSVEAVANHIFVYQDYYLRQVGDYMMCMNVAWMVLSTKKKQ